MIVGSCFYTQDRQDFQSCCFGKMMSGGLKAVIMMTVTLLSQITVNEFDVQYKLLWQINVVSSYAAQNYARR